MTTATGDGDGVHVPRPLPHPRSTAVFVSGALSLLALVAASLTFAAHFAVVSALTGLAAVSIGRRVIAEVDASPTLFSGRHPVLATVGAAGVSTGVAACALAGLVAAAF